MPCRSASCASSEKSYGGVVGDDRDAGIQQRAQRVDDLLDDVARRRADRPRVLGRDAVDRGRADSGISMPGSAIQSRARIDRAARVEQPDVRA